LNGFAQPVAQAPSSPVHKLGGSALRTRGNELVVWIDDEKRRDLFTELQMCHDHGSYANSAGVASDPENRSTQDLSGFWFRP